VECAWLPQFPFFLLFCTRSGAALVAKREKHAAAKREKHAAAEREKHAAAEREKHAAAEREKHAAERLEHAAEKGSWKKNQPDSPSPRRHFTRVNALSRWCNSVAPEKVL